jgi:hypothetical protein
MDPPNKKSSRPRRFSLQALGLGAGILYKSPSWKILVGYGYGVNAIRSSGRGAQSVGLLLQLDLGKAREAMLNTQDPSRWRGFQNMFNFFGK